MVGQSEWPTISPGIRRQATKITKEKQRNCGTTGLQ